MKGGVGESGKFVQRLVRMIGEKEKLIDQLRMSQRMRVGCRKKCRDGGSSMEEERLHFELEDTRQEMKQLVGKMEVMEVRMAELSVGLREEMSINEKLQATVKELKNTENQLREKIGEFQGRNVQLLSKNVVLEQELLKNAELFKKFQKQLEQANKKVEVIDLMERRIETMTDKMRETYQFLWEVGQKIEGMQHLIGIGVRNIQTDLSQYFVTKPKEHVFYEVKERLTLLLEKTEHYLRKVKNQNQQEFLNETLDGLSMIMLSFEQKLEHLNCLTDRMNTPERKQVVKLDSILQSIDAEIMIQQMTASKELLMTADMVSCLPGCY